MVVKDVIRILLDFPMESPCFVLTKQDDLNEIVGQNFPELKFGSVVVSSFNKEDGNEAGEENAVVILGNFDKYKKEEEGDKKE